MLFGRDARDAHGRRRAIRKELHKRIGIFVRDHTCNRPCCRGVIGGKRCSTFPEAPVGVVLIGTLASSGVRNRFDNGDAIERCFSAEKTGFAFVIVVREQPEKVKAACTRSHGIDSVVRNVTVAGQGVRVVREMPAEAAVGREERSAEAAQGHKPGRIRETRVARA